MTCNTTSLPCLNLNLLLSLNVEKTNFHSPLKTINTTNLSLSINNKIIKEVTSTKYLGLLIHSSLKWNTHIDSIIETVSPSIGILRRLNNNTPNYILRNIYYAHIHSRLPYLCQIWGPATPAYKLAVLQTLQNKALRNLFTHDYILHNISTTDLFAKYSILNINQIVHCTVLLQVQAQSHEIVSYYQI